MKNIYDMYDFFESLTNIEDPRQFKKVKYPINAVVEMVLIASLGNANEWTKIEVFCKLHETLLRKYFKLEKGIPSHDTFQRVMENQEILHNDLIAYFDDADFRKEIIKKGTYKKTVEKSHG